MSLLPLVKETCFMPIIQSGVFHACTKLKLPITQFCLWEPFPVLCNIVKQSRLCGHYVMMAIAVSISEVNITVLKYKCAIVVL